ncbi:uncharacterized protein TNCV_569991 [Trichonephila clavipes]|nr:uncharacterized protein TNCV_569991 [Trichonephila clavipes]
MPNHDFILQEYQSQIDTQQIFYMLHKNVTCVPMIFASRKSIDSNQGRDCNLRFTKWAAVAEWYRYRIVACHVTSSSPVPPKTRRVGQRCTLNLSRAETSSRWCGVVVRRRGGASSGVVHVT